MLALALLFAAAADPCAPPAPASPDPATAAIYVEEGEAELGHDSARIAFAEALRLDPANERARRGLLLACTPPEERFERGRQLLEAGDPRSAVVLFDQVRAEEGPAPAASLLAGISRYRLHEDERARSALEEAAQDPAVSDSARFFLGLIALREGREEDAQGQLSQVRESSGLHGNARDLMRLAGLGGRAAITASADSGFDSNVTLAPSGVPGGGDGVGGLSGTGVLRPFGPSGPYARATGQYRAQLQLHDYDLAAFGGGAGWQLGSWQHNLAAEYAYDFLALGGAPYLSAHRLAATGRWRFDDLVLSGGYSVRFESFQQAGSTGFSGTLHSAQARIGFGAWDLGYAVARDFATLSGNSYREHGPRVAFQTDLAPRWRAFADGALSLRQYDGAYAGSSQARSDVLADLAGTVEYDFSDRWSARLSLGGRKAFSNVDALAYVRVTGALGVAYSLGFW